MHHHGRGSFTLLPVPVSSRWQHVWGFLGFLELAKGNVFLSAYPESHGWRPSLLLSVSLRGCRPIQKAMVGGPHSFSVCLQEAVRVGSTVVRGIPAPEVHLEGSRILPRMRSRVPVPAERWLHVTSPTMPQIKTLPPRSFAINRRILRERLRMAGFRH